MRIFLISVFIFLNAILSGSSCSKGLVTSEEFICNVESGTTKDSTALTNTNTSTGTTNTNTGTTTNSEKDVAIPKFSLENGRYKFGTEVILTAETGTEIEFSWDEGKTWIKGNKTLIRRSACLFAKAKIAKKESAVVRADYKVLFERVLYIGNSITIHGPLAGTDWNNNWGMAATAPDKDYVSLVDKYLYTANPNLKSQRFSAVAFERDFVNYNYQNANFPRDYNPDLIIVRIGENVDNISAHNNKFAEHIKKLVDYIKDKKTVRVVVTNCFWRKNDLVAFQLGEFVRLANDAGLEYNFADLSKLELEFANSAGGIFKDSHVAAHPSDKGMKAIADAITAQIKL